MKLRTTLKKSSFLGFNVRCISQWTSFSKITWNTSTYWCFSPLFVRRKKNIHIIWFLWFASGTAAEETLEETGGIGVPREGGRSWGVTKLDQVGNLLGITWIFSWEFVGKNLGCPPLPVTVANEGLEGFPTKNIIILVPGSDCYWCYWAGGQPKK